MPSPTARLAIEKSALRFVFVPLYFLFISACSVGPRHTSDSKLEQNFFLHEPEFEGLLAEVQTDEKLMMIRLHELRFAGRSLSSDKDFPEIERLGLTKERWARHQRQLRDLGIEQIAKGMVNGAGFGRSARAGTDQCHTAC
jgi:hypothetical protein